MQRSIKTEFGRTMTEMLSVVVIMSLVMIATLAGLKSLRERAAVAELQKSVATRIVQRVHSLQTPLASTKNPVDDKGPYGFPIHVENGVSGAKADYFWISLGAFQGEHPKTLSYAMCQRFLSTMTDAIAPAALEVNGVSKPVDPTSCIDAPNGIVLTLFYPKSTASQRTLLIKCKPECQKDEACLESGCCKINLLGTSSGVCCDYLDMDGQCVYKGHTCPDGQIWDETTGDCISSCPQQMTWQSGHCTCPVDRPLYQNGQCVTCSAQATLCKAGEKVQPDNGCPCDCIDPLHEINGLCLPNNVCSGLTCVFLCKNSQCVCPDNTYGDGEHCTQCPANSSSTAGMNATIDQCTCYPGYEKNEQNQCVFKAVNLGEDCSATGLMSDPNTQKCVCDSNNTLHGRYYLKGESCVQCPSKDYLFTGTDCLNKDELCGANQVFVLDNNASITDIDYIPAEKWANGHCECIEGYSFTDALHTSCAPCEEVIAAKGNAVTAQECNLCLKTLWDDDEEKCIPCGNNTQKVSVNSGRCAACEYGYYKQSGRACKNCPVGFAAHDWTDYSEGACTDCTSGFVSAPNGNQYCCPKDIDPSDDDKPCCTTGPTDTTCLGCINNDGCPTGTVCDQNKCRRLCDKGEYTYYVGEKISKQAQNCGASFAYGTKEITVSGHVPFRLDMTSINAAEIVSIKGSNGSAWHTLYHNGTNQPTCNENLTQDCPLLANNADATIPSLGTYYYEKYRITALWKDTCQSVSYSAYPLQLTPTSKLYCSPVKLHVQ